MTTTKHELRQFGVVFSIGIIIIFGLALPLLAQKPVPSWVPIATLPVALIALILPIVLKPFYYVWMKIGAVLGWINTRIILGFIYFVVFLPVGLVLTLLRKDPMSRRFDKEMPSYRKISNPTPAKNLERPF